MEHDFKKPNGLIIESKYQIDEPFSKGGMSSELYSGHLVDKPDKKIIIKIIYKTKETEKYWQRFIDETITNNRLAGRTNIVDTLDSFYSDNEIYIIMDHVEGKTLRHYLNNHGCIIPQVAIKVFRVILIPIKIMHDFKHQIIHRDLKPENIIVSDDLTKVTLIDFGISSVIDNTLKTMSHDNTNLSRCITDEKDVWGTYSYLLPDLIDYDNNIEKAFKNGITVEFDFFSLGVILYEMLIGEKPFIGDDNSKIMTYPKKYDMPPISQSNPHIPTRLENVVFRCLACKPEDKKYRFKNADEIIHEIDEIIKFWGRPENNTPLIKPYRQRIYKGYQNFNIDFIKKKQPIIKQWYFFIIVICIVVVISISTIIVLK